jgi:ABC-type multidrug transport system ATPase subunit
MKSKNDVHAVKGVWFEAADRELLSLLGHNGAGKSTTFSMLTGVLNPTEGQAKICGFDIRTDIQKIRQLMGVVPQFDILWGELTAYEHMSLFSQIKGVNKRVFESSIDELLESVGLLRVKHARVANFSGGMKRRLSVAIACIGNPRIIFLDEPTTGMDPVSRRDVWTLVQKLKKDKVVILTTHAMEEADILSDRIAVVCDGKLKCIGTPLYLKNTFGDGYRITFVIEPGNEKSIIDLMNIIAPSNKLLDDAGGSMVFSVQIDKISEIAPLFSLLQQEGS